MGRRSLPSDTVPAEVRRYYGLQQQELAAYLGISRTMLANLEAGRRPLASHLLLRLLPLAQRVPARVPLPAAPADWPPTDPSPLPLEARLDECLHQAGNLRRQLRGLLEPVRYAVRWQQVLPGLLASDALAAWPADAAHAHRWLLARQQQVAAELADADRAAQVCLLRLRAEALETEAQALAALLPQVPVWAQAALAALAPAT